MDKIKATHFVYFGAGATPKMGSGWRCVALLKLGHKWAHLYYPAEDLKFRITKKAWLELVALGHELEDGKIKDGR